MTDAPATLAHDGGNEAGFSLVEVLVALALFSLLATLLFTSVRSGAMAWQRGSSRADQFEHSTITRDLLRRLIGDIYPMAVMDNGAKPRIDFEGSKDALSFLGSAPIAAGSGGRFRFRLATERQGSRADLVVHAAPELVRPDDTSMTRRTLLVSDIDRVEFAYFGVAAPARSVQWHDDWVQRSDMPKLVRIRVAFRQGDVRSWSELLIAPRIAADVGCIYDLVTKRCQGR